jgi:hypothetical protein
MKLPKNLRLHYPGGRVVLFDGVPLWRSQAWALFDARLNGVHFILNSANRKDSVIKRFRNKGLRPGYMSQQELIDGHARDPIHFMPANPVNRTSHAGFSDGNPFYDKPAGAEISKWKWGIDAVNTPGGSADELVAWLNKHGYKAVKPYASLSERHHFAFATNPATNARKRLAKHFIKKATIRGVSKKGVALVAKYEGFVELARISSPSIVERKCLRPLLGHY